MKKLLEMLADAISSGEDAVLVTVVASSGSTPRGAGARMLITKNGRLCGTIGGGAVEYRSEQMAAEVLKSRSSKLESFRLHPNEVADLGMICGGAVDVYFRFIPGFDPHVEALLGRIGELYRRRERFWLICDITGGEAGAMAAYGVSSGLYGAQVPEDVLAQLGKKAKQIKSGDRVYYCEQLLDAGRVFVFGGGHVAQALVPELARVGFRCVVLEDRPDFARPELFPGVEETRIVDIADLSAVVGEITPDDYVCVMTRGHKDDCAVQGWMLRSKARYIGVIGSSKKTASVFDRLRAEGFTDADFSRVTAPIGLPIGGETPAEIAVSIAAQLIMVRAGKGTRL
jgi:xanthine dehydrogenase accessory factor